MLHYLETVVHVHRAHACVIASLFMSNLVNRFTVFFRRKRCFSDLLLSKTGYGTTHGIHRICGLAGGFNCFPDEKYAGPAYCEYRRVRVVYCLRKPVTIGSGDCDQCRDCWYQLVLPVTENQG